MTIKIRKAEGLWEIITIEIDRESYKADTAMEVIISSVYGEKGNDWDFPQN